MAGSTKALIAHSTTVSIDLLELWDRNPRSIKTERFTELKERLKRQGQIKPLLVAKDGKTVIGGNMRLRAMRELGIEEVWVSQTQASTDKEIFDLALTDNEEFGYFEQEQVAELAIELGLSPLELKSYALSLGEPTTLDLVLDKFGPEVEEDEVPEVDEVSEQVSVLGEVYQLGGHRLMCGDSTDADAVAELMDGAKADMVFTDPPYGVDYEGINNDNRDGLENLLLESFNLMKQYTKVGGAVYCFHSDRCADIFHTVFRKFCHFSSMIIWAKPSLVLSQTDYQSKHEPCLYGWFEGGNHYWFSDRQQTSIWEADAKAIEGHTTPKPQAIIMRAIKNSSQLDSKVLDLFGGSGSTLIACEQTNRTCYMMELDPKYCDVIRKRYAKHIGEEEAWQEVTPAVKSLAAV
jgi:DNA modification methylase